MWGRRLAAVLGLLLLAGCGDRSLHLKVHYRDADGLHAGAPVVKGGAAIGTVESIAADPEGGYLVGIAIADKFAAAATSASRFYLSDQAREPGKKQIEIEQTTLGGPVLAEGATVEGSERSAPLAPLGNLLRQFGQGIQGLRGQLEQFQQELRKIPDSPEAKRLQDEWQRLTEEMAKAQAETEESVKKDLLPRLQQEMDRLQERFRDFRSRPAPPQQAPRPI